MRACVRACVRVCVCIDDMVSARRRASAIEERELGPAYDDDTPYVRVAGYPEGQPQPCTGIFDISCRRLVSARLASAHLGWQDERAGPLHLVACLQLFILPAACLHCGPNPPAIHARSPHEQRPSGGVQDCRARWA